VLVMQLRPEDEVADDEYAAILRHGGLAEADTLRLRVERDGIPPLDLGAFSAIIVGGSPFDISTPVEDKSPMQRRLEADFDALLTRVVARDFPFLGCCSGCGLLGARLGTPITRRYGEPVGVVQVTVTEAGHGDPLLVGFPDRIEVLCGHKEACDRVPEGATLLLTGHACPVQMFRVGRNVYATQFHPEGDAEGFTLRIQTYRNHGYFPPETADALITAVSAVDTPYGRELLRRFVARYVRLP
jgi:GMP synthase (glutamine-hydrolysing)